MITSNGYDSNIIVNMMIATAITTLVTSLTKIIPLIFEKLKVYFEEIYDYLFNQKNISGKVVITGTTIQSHGGIRPVFPIEYRAIIAHIKKEKVNLKHISYVDKNDDLYGGYFKRGEQEISKGVKENKFYVKSKSMFHLKNSIDIRFENYNSQIGNEQNPQLITYSNIVVLSKYHSVDELQNIIIKWTKDYLEEIKCANDDNKQYFFGLEYSKKIETNDKKNELSGTTTTTSSNLKWNKYELISFKTFDNIFFRDKNILLKKLNYFLNKESDYKKKGIPYNLGFLYYGDPGCGKTSCIKAIANYTNRHVVEINLKNIKSCKDFVNTFNMEYIDEQYVPHKNKIIVLEDIDCMIDIVKSRKEDSSPDDYTNLGDVKDDMVKLMMMKEKNEMEEKKKLQELISDDKLTLSCILNTIDGILESYGRILIITTNYVDRLDSALIRPGRIDMKVDFTKCTIKMYYEMIENYFECKLDEDIAFIEYKHTPAEVIDVCCLYNDDLEKVIRVLTGAGT